MSNQIDNYVLRASDTTQTTCPLLRGLAGTSVTLTLMRPGERGEYRVNVQRKRKLEKNVDSAPPRPSSAQVFEKNRYSYRCHFHDREESKIPHQDQALSLSRVRPPPLCRESLQSLLCVVCQRRFQIDLFRSRFPATFPPLHLDKAGQCVSQPSRIHQVRQADHHQTQPQCCM